MGFFSLLLLLLFFFFFWGGGGVQKGHTVNVNIFAGIYFRRFLKMGKFVWIKIRIFCITGSWGYYKSNFQCVLIFADIKKRELQY